MKTTYLSAMQAALDGNDLEFVENLRFYMRSRLEESMAAGTLGDFRFSEKDDSIREHQPTGKLNLRGIFALASAELQGVDHFLLYGITPEGCWVQVKAFLAPNSSKIGRVEWETIDNERVLALVTPNKIIHDFFRAALQNVKHRERLLRDASYMARDLMQLMQQYQLG